MTASVWQPVQRASTHKRLNDEVRGGRFREDLYFQIGVTADALGISRKSLWERMKRLAIG